MSRKVSKLAGVAVALALLASPASVIASTRSVAAPAQTSASAWTTLSTMSSASSTSATLAAAQGDFGYRDRDRRGIPAPVLAVWLATIGLAIWILLHDDDDGNFSFSPD